MTGLSRDSITAARTLLKARAFTAVCVTSLGLDQTDYTIVGVGPEGFRGHVTGLDAAHHQLWLPLPRHPRLTATATARLDRESGWVHVAGKLAPAVTMAQADATTRPIRRCVAPSTTPSRPAFAWPRPGPRMPKSCSVS